MKKIRAVKTAILAAGLFFMLVALAGILSEWGNSTLAAKLMPLDHQIWARRGKQIIASANKEREREQLKKAVASFSAAVKKNPLDFSSHFVAAQAYLRLSGMGEDTFAKAGQAFKKALFLRWKNPEIGLRALNVALSVWPLLTEEDRIFYRNLGGGVIGLAKQKEFQSILETWGYYSRDIGFLKEVLEKAPRYYRKAAEFLAEKHMSLETRWDFMARFEKFSFASFKKQFQRNIRERRNNYNSWKHISRHLENSVNGYHRLATQVKFDCRACYDFINRLRLSMVFQVAGSMVWLRNEKLHQEIIDLANKIILCSPAKKVLDRLFFRLERTRFFLESDLRVYSLKLSLLLARNELSEVIRLGSKFMDQHHYVTPEEKDQIRKIMLQISEAHFLKKDYSAALAVLQAAEQRTGKTDRISRALAYLQYRTAAQDSAVEPGTGVQWTENVIVTRTLFRGPVLGQKKDLLTFDFSALAAAVSSAKNLVQIRFDRKIAAEFYLKRITDGIVKIPLNRDSGLSGIEVEVKVLR